MVETFGCGNAERLSFILWIETPAIVTVTVTSGNLGGRNKIYWVYIVFD